MLLLEQIAEQKILEAIQDGLLDDLPGSGSPLQLEDDSLIPEQLRAGYRVLKNAGFLPKEMQLRSEIADVDTLLIQACSVERRHSLNIRKYYLLMQLGLIQVKSPLLCEHYYQQK